MKPLIAAANLAQPGDTYALLLAAHNGLGKDQSDALTAAFILILCNHIGDQTVIAQALALAAP